METRFTFRLHVGLTSSPSPLKSRKNGKKFFRFIASGPLSAPSLVSPLPLRFGCSSGSMSIFYFFLKFRRLGRSSQISLTTQNIVSTAVQVYSLTDREARLPSAALAGANRIIISLFL